MVTVREGVTYRDANGGKRGPMKDYHETDGYPFSVPDEDCGWWSMDGRAQPDSVFPGVDLIAEWTDGPVRTVTRTVTETTIEPGHYAGLKVDLSPAKGFVCVGIGMDSRLWSSAELKAAAAVLLELAGALDSE